MRPRLDDGNSAHALATTRRRKKCSHSGISGSASATGLVYGYLGNNASTLVYHPSYSTSASSQASQAYAKPMPHQAAGQGSTSGSPPFGKSALGSLDHVNSGPLAAGSGNAGGSPGVCPLQSTITTTTRYTITVTQAAAVATTAGAAEPLQDGSIVSGSKGRSQAQNGSGNNSNSSDSLVVNGVSASGSIGPKGTKCGKGNASGTAAASTSTGTGDQYGNGSMRGSKSPVSANASLSSVSDTSSNSSAPLIGINSTASMNYTSDANLRGEFWAGGMSIQAFSPPFR